MAEFIQQQIQIVFQPVLLHMVQQLSERVVAAPPQTLSLATFEATRQNEHWFYRHDSAEDKESKVTESKKISGKRNQEIYWWFTQLCLVFRGKPRTHVIEEDRVVYVLSYLTRASESWAMPLLQALDEGHQHELLYD